MRDTIATYGKSLDEIADARAKIRGAQSMAPKANFFLCLTPPTPDNQS
jgi:hypothetical protein